jgi:hypothetical protein
MGTESIVEDSALFIIYFFDSILVLPVPSSSRCLTVTAALSDFFRMSFELFDDVIVVVAAMVKILPEFLLNGPAEERYFHLEAVFRVSLEAYTRFQTGHDSISPWMDPLHHELASKFSSEIRIDVDLMHALVIL